MRRRKKTRRSGPGSDGIERWSGVRHVPITCGFDTTPCDGDRDVKNDADQKQQKHFDDDREDAKPDGHGGDLGEKQGDKCSGDEGPEHSYFSCDEKRTAPMTCVAKGAVRSVATLSDY